MGSLHVKNNSSLRSGDENGRAEIWAAERYEEEEANVSAEELAALMEEIGI